jgi:hypothetical protein
MSTTIEERVVAAIKRGVDERGRLLRNIRYNRKELAFAIDSMVEIGRLAQVGKGERAKYRVVDPIPQARPIVSNAAHDKERPYVVTEVPTPTGRIVKFGDNWKVGKGQSSRRSYVQGVSSIEVD